MTKITFLIRCLDRGGAERNLLTLAQGLHNREGFDVTVLYFYPGGDFEKDLSDDGIKMICLEKQGRWDLFHFFRRLVQHLRLIRPDVLHGYLVEPNLLTVLLKPFFPSTRMLWWIGASVMDFDHYDWFPRLTFRVQCLLSRYADLIIINSNAGRDYHLARGFPPDRSLVIYTGINTSLFKPDAEARARVRAEWRVSEGEILIGLVGRLDPIKDHPNFLKAAALLCRERDDVRFVCVGDGPKRYARELSGLAAELGIAEKLIWAGVRAEMPAVHNALDLATSSSVSEGLPTAIEEAMACGVPCVVTDVGDSALIVGESGIVVPPRNPEALAAGWQACLMKDRVEMGLKARSRILEGFSAERQIMRTKSAILAAT